MRIFHFSDDGAIRRFEPRPSEGKTRPLGLEWLNGPLVWAVREDWQAIYLFPRECPRIVLWRKPDSTAEDVQRLWGDGDVRMIAYIEAPWRDALETQPLYRYDLPASTFEDLGGLGHYVSRSTVDPIAMDTIDDLPAALVAQSVELRVVPLLVEIKTLWDSSLHVSGFRMGNAQGWSGD